MKRFWPALLLLIPLAVALPFLPLRRIAWRVTRGEQAAYAPRWIVWLMSHQRPDGAWDEGPAVMEGHPLGRPGTTGLALLTFLGAGYSQLSKDQYEWYEAGPAVRNALQFLIRDQLPDGSFRSSAGMLDHTLATIALSEAYGMTGSNLLQQEAQAAVDALQVRVRVGDLRDDSSLHAWAAMTLWSAENSGLRIKPETLDRIRAFYDARTGATDAGEIIARMAADKKKDHARIPPGIAALAARPARWEQQDFAGWYWTALALFQYDGPTGTAWKGWEPSLKPTLIQTQTSRGDWPGQSRGETFVRTCQATLTLMTYYRYANVFGTK